MVSRSTPTEILKHIKLYFDTCASHISTPFKEEFFTLNEDHTAGTLNGIYSGITIWGTGTVKYVMLDWLGTAPMATKVDRKLTI